MSITLRLQSCNCTYAYCSIVHA